MLPNNGAQSTPGLIAGLLNSLIDKVESGKINQCKYCHKSFSRKNDLKRHIDSHLQTKNFGCTDCDYRCKHVRYGTHYMVRPVKRQRLQKL